ncbi:MAG: hypothetical protein HY719_10510, partial [Planctomycetes bacterium]|nr:hypothetical protein [Planctomycetota bacterium]
RAARAEMEIGAGAGDLLFARAAALPGTLFVAVENVAPLYHRLKEREARARTTNTLILNADGEEVLREGAPEGSLDRVTLFFPDPWPKTRHAKRRLIRPNTLPAFFRALRDGGALVARTDDDGLADWIAEVLRDLPGHAGARVVPPANERDPVAPGDPLSDPVDAGVTTRYERKARDAGRPVREFRWVKPAGARFEPRPEHLAPRHRRGVIEARIEARERQAAP